MSDNVKPALHPYFRAGLKNLMMFLPSDQLQTEVDCLLQEIKQDRIMPKTSEALKQDEISEKLTRVLLKLDEILEMQKVFIKPEEDIKVDFDLRPLAVQALDVIVKHLVSGNNPQQSSLVLNRVQKVVGAACLVIGEATPDRMQRLNFALNQLADCAPLPRSMP